MNPKIREHKDAVRERHREYSCFSMEYFNLYGYFCWACGTKKRPRWWHGPWMLERAHIVKQPRLQDRRCAVLICSACHKVQEGETIRQWTLPRLTVANMLWLKQEHDPQYYDLKLLQACSVRILPQPEPYEPKQQ